MRKNLDLSDSCVKTLSKRAIDENTVFKKLAEFILENAANPNGFEKTKAGGAVFNYGQISTNFNSEQFFRLPLTLDNKKCMGFKSSNLSTYIEVN